MTHGFTPASAALERFIRATDASHSCGLVGDDPFRLALAAKRPAANEYWANGLPANGLRANLLGLARFGVLVRCVWVLVGCLWAEQSVAAIPALDGTIDGTLGGDAIANPAANPAVPDVKLLYFTQASCGPCRQMQPMIEHLAGRGFPIVKIDAQTQAEWTQRFQVQRTPTFVLLQDGQELKRHSGVLSSYQINAMLIDGGYAADQDVLTKPNALSPLVNFFDRLRPATGGVRGGTPAAVASAAVPLGPTTRQSSDPTAAIPLAELSAAEQLALQATARLKVEYQDRGQTVTDYGTGTVIHRHDDDILILTCGHVFRDSRGRGTLRVELDFSRGQPQEVVLGQLLLYDDGAADVALVAAKTRLPLAPMPLADAELRLQEGTTTFSVGCDFGQPATVRRGSYLAAVRCGPVQAASEPAADVMARKFAVAGRPVVGRSGGGLFTTNGQLIGVCNAAVVESNEGRYSAIDNVHAMLQQAKLAATVEQPYVVASERTLGAAVDNPGGGSVALAATDSRRATSRPGRFLPLIEAPQALASQPGPRLPGPVPPASPRSTQAMGQSLR